jgi:tetratricopeptide (TPR) repeat protein
MLRLCQSVITSIAVMFVSFMIPNVVLIQSAYASGFPGQGSAADWSDAIPHYNLGNKYLNEGRYDDAARKFRDAIQRYQFDPDFYENLGVANQKLGDYIGAEQAFKQAVELNDKDWSAWMDLGNAYVKQDRLKDALHTFEHTLQMNPPAADRKFLLDDISDIHKVLRNTGQEPMPEPPGAKSKNGRVPANKKTANAKSTTPHKVGAASAANQSPVAPATAAPASTTPGKDWGY